MSEAGNRAAIASGLAEETRQQQGVYSQIGIDAGQLQGNLVHQRDKLGEIYQALTLAHTAMEEVVVGLATETERDSSELKERTTAGVASLADIITRATTLLSGTGSDSGETALGQLNVAHHDAEETTQHAAHIHGLTSDAQRVAATLHETIRKAWEAAGQMQLWSAEAVGANRQADTSRAGVVAASASAAEALDAYASAQ